jgi:hypothetical protein
LAARKNKREQQHKRLGALLASFDKFYLEISNLDDDFYDLFSPSNDDEDTAKLEKNIDRSIAKLCKAWPKRIAAIEKKARAVGLAPKPETAVTI